MNEITIATEHDDPEVIAAAISPDNTDEVETAIENGRVVTHIERERLGSLRATVDDYFRALHAASETAQLVTPDHETQP